MITTMKAKHTYLASAIALALPVLMPLSQKSIASEEEWSLEEIVVTARRKQESLQDVPTSVSAVGREDLEALQIDGFQSVGQTVPNVYIQKQGGMPTAPQMQIRGVSNGSLNYQVDSGIGMYVDGVYIGRASGASFDLADLERVEVLRGPQGTLFGRNSTGGAINLITSEPTGELGAKLQVGLGNFEARRYKATLELPEWNGFKARLNLSHSEEEGDVDNLAEKRTFVFPEPFGAITTNDRGGDNETDAVFLAVKYEGIESLTLDYKYDRSDWEGTMNYRQVGNMGPCADFNTTPGQCIISSGLVRAVHPLSLSFDYEDAQAVPLESTGRLDVRGHSLTAEYELTDTISVKYIGGYREHELDVGGNQVWGGGEYINDGMLPGPVGGVFTPLFAMRIESQEQTSHEIQLLGGDDNLDWIVGAFFYEEEGHVNAPILLSRVIGDTSTTDINPIDAANFDYFVGQNVKVRNESSAVYAHATYHLGDFDISGGVRYTEDDRQEDVIAAGLIGLFTPSAEFSTNGSHTDYDFSVTYNLSNDANVYFKYATGYVSGGTIFGNAFDEEEMVSYEIGIKSDLLDHRLRVNAALFNQKRTDVQIEGFTGVGYFMGVGRDVSVDGVELEVTYMPMESLTLNASYGYTDVDNSGDLRTFQPKQTAYLGMQYDFAPFDNGVQASFRMDMSWRDDVHRLLCEAGQDQVPASDVCVGTADEALDDLAQIDASTMLGAQLSIADIPVGDTSARVSIWGRNLLDEDGKEYGFTLGGPTLTSTFVRPRTYGVDVSIEF